MLRGDSVARRKCVNPASSNTARRRASPAWAPSPSPTSCDSEFGVQIAEDAVYSSAASGFSAMFVASVVERHRLDEEHRAAGLEVLAPRSARCPPGSPMSWRQSKKQMRSYVPVVLLRAGDAERPCGPMTPASVRTRLARCSIDAAWKSNPWIVEFGYASAMTTTDAPWPQPTSATGAPSRAARSATPSSAGSTSWRGTRGSRDGRTTRSRGTGTRWWSPQLIAPSPRNTSARRCPSIIMAMSAFMPRAMNVATCRRQGPSRPRRTSRTRRCPRRRRRCPRPPGCRAITRREARVAPGCCGHVVGAAAARTRRRAVVAELVAEPDRQCDRAARHVPGQLTDELLDPRLVDHDAPPRHRSVLGAYDCPLRRRRRRRITGTGRGRRACRRGAPRSGGGDRWSCPVLPDVADDLARPRTVWPTDTAISTGARTAWPCRRRGRSRRCCRSRPATRRSRPCRRGRPGSACRYGDAMSTPGVEAGAAADRVGPVPEPAHDRAGYRPVLAAARRRPRPGAAARSCAAISSETAWNSVSSVGQLARRLCRESALLVRRFLRSLRAGGLDLGAQRGDRVLGLLDLGGGGVGLRLLVARAPCAAPRSRCAAP